MRNVRTTLSSCTLALLVAAGCTGDTTVPESTNDASIVATNLQHALVGPGGRRGTLRADSAVLGEALGTVRLIRPRISLTASAARPMPVELGADSGALDVQTGVVRLFAPGIVSGAPAWLVGRDTVAYDPVGDSLTALPADDTAAASR